MGKEPKNKIYAPFPQLKIPSKGSVACVYSSSKAHRSDELETFTIVQIYMYVS